MDRIDFTQPGGFPLDQEILNIIQDNAVMASAAAFLGGSQFILDGCIDAGANTGNGIIRVNGETLPFVGGTRTTKVVIVEDITGLVYEDGSTKASQQIRYATFGDDGVTTILWANFKRIPSGGLIAAVADLNTALTAFEALFGVWQTSNSMAGSTITAGASITNVERKWIIQRDVVTINFVVQFTISSAGIKSINIPLPVNVAAYAYTFGDQFPLHCVNPTAGSYINGGGLVLGGFLVIASYLSFPTGTYLVSGQFTYQKA